jgi:NADPH2:quinone reductase
MARNDTANGSGEMMRFVDHGSGGSPDVLAVSRMSQPAPQQNEVLIRVHAAGVNRPDVEQRKGHYPPPPEANPILGLEVAGTVTAVGSAVKHLKVGERVCALTNGGGYAEYCVAPAGQCLPWPDGYSAEEAAALPENFFTVWANLFGIGRLSSGETALVHGGTSGIGLTAIRLGARLGATMIATAGSAEKVKVCLDAGASFAFDYTNSEFPAAVKEFTQGRGVDVVLDIVGAAYFNRNLECLAVGGRLIMLGFMGGYITEPLDVRQIIKRRLTIAGSAMRPRTEMQKAAIAQELYSQVWPILSAGECRPIIQQVFPLERAEDAHRMMEESKHVGKIVLNALNKSPAN